VTITLRHLAELVGGELVGDASCTITAARPIKESGSNDITFVEHEKYLPQLAGCSAAAAVVAANIELPGKNLIRVANPFGAFLAIAQLLHGRPPLTAVGVSPQAAVDPTAIIGADANVHPLASIGAGCVIGQRCRIHPGATIAEDCVLSDDVTLHSHVVVYPGTIIGSRVIIHANAVIGADGFGYRFHDGRHVKVPQLGGVEIGDDVEIGAGTTIDRGTFSVTRIGAGTKIDNLVMIAHNCQIGRHNIIVSQTGIAGSSSTGDFVIIAGQVGIADHLHIGDRSVLGARSAVARDVPPDSRMLGSPATPEKEQKRILMSLLHLPEFRKELRQLHDRMDKAA
jgi:UDP-3-O-[3-hydroxymyristoyl] glucosamine N-acyltransferase